jgi:hypothetical protein
VAPSTPVAAPAPAPLQRSSAPGVLLPAAVVVTRRLASRRVAATRSARRARTPPRPLRAAIALPSQPATAPAASAAQPLRKKLPPALPVVDDPDVVAGHTQQAATDEQYTIDELIGDMDEDDLRIAYAEAGLALPVEDGAQEPQLRRVLSEHYAGLSELGSARATRLANSRASPKRSTAPLADDDPSAAVAQLHRTPRALTAEEAAAPTNTPSAVQPRPTTPPRHDREAAAATRHLKRTPPALPPPPSTAAAAAPTDTLRVTVVRAEGLLPKDRSGTSDPFVELFIREPLPAAGRSPPRVRTPVIKKTLAPSWDRKNTFELDVIDEQAALLVCSVFDDDLVGRDFIGSVEVSGLGSFCGESGEPPAEKAYTLADGKVQCGQLVLKLEYEPSAAQPRPATPPRRDGEAAAATRHLSLLRRLTREKEPLPDLGTLHVTVHRAENLKVADSPSAKDGTGGATGSSDPFVKLALRDQVGPVDKAQTPFVVATLNPVWQTGNSFQLHVREDSAVLFCHVYDDDPGFDDYLGEVKIPVKQLMDSGELANIPGKQQSFELKTCTDSDARMWRERRAQGITGSLWLSFIFQPAGMRQKHPLGWIEVTVLQCDGLQAADRDGASDPFVTATIDQPGLVESASTSCLHGTVNPKWGPDDNNVLCLAVRSKYASLVCHVADKDRLLGMTVIEQFLGEAIIDLAAYIAGDPQGQQSSEMTMPLGVQTYQALNKYVQQTSTASGAAEERGSITIKVQFKPWVAPPPPLGELAVTVVMAEGLKTADLGSHNDTYCEIMLEQTKGSHNVQYKTHRTSTIHNTKDPVWDTSNPFMLRVRDEEATLFAHCFDEDLGADDFIGQASVPVSIFMAEPNKPKVVKLPVGTRTHGVEVDNTKSKKWCCRQDANFTGTLTLKCEFKPNDVGLDAAGVSLDGISVDTDDDWLAKPSHKPKKLLCGCGLLWALAIGSLILVLVVVTAAAVNSVSGCTDVNAINYDPAASINRQSTCVLKTCSTDIDCNTPRGTCQAGVCVCANGFSGENCMTLQKLFASRISSSVVMSGSVSQASLQQSVAALQPGVDASDVTISGVVQNVTTTMQVPIVTTVQTRAELGVAIAAAAGVPPSGVIVTHSSNAARGLRRRLQASVVLVEIRANRDIFDTVTGGGNVSKFTAKVVDEVKRVCTACASFTSATLSATVPVVTTLFSYHVAPRFQSATEAQQFGEALLGTLRSSTATAQLSTALSQSGATLMSAAVGELTVTEAYVRIVDGLFGQLQDVLSKWQSDLLSLSDQAKTLDFGGWTLQVRVDLLAAQVPITVDVVTPVLLGQVLVDVTGLPPAVEQCIAPFRTAQIQNMTITVSKAPAMIELTGWLAVADSASMFRIIADRNDQGEWGVVFVGKFSDLWASLTASLHDSIGQLVDHVRVPDLATVVLSRPSSPSALSGRRQVQSAQVVQAGISMALGMMPQLETIPSLRSLLAGGASQASVMASLTSNLQDGIAGTMEFRGRTLALVLTSNDNDGIKLGASLSGAPISLREAFGSAQVAFNKYFQQEQDVMATVTKSALEPLLDTVFSDLRLGLKTDPPTLEVFGNVTWRNISANFELCVSKNTTSDGGFWDWGLVVEVADLSFLTAGLEEYMDLPQVEMGAAVMISPQATPSVRIGTTPLKINAAGAPQMLGQVPIASTLRPTVLQLIQPVVQGRRMQSSAVYLAGLGSVSGTLAASNLQAEFAYAQSIADNAIDDLSTFVNDRLREGVRGTVEFRNRSLDLYVKASEQAGMTFGAAMDTSDAPINVGEALSTVFTRMQQAFAPGQQDGSGIASVISGPLQTLKSVEISQIELTGRTAPPSLTVAGTISVNGVTTDLEFALTKNVSGVGHWDWALASQWNQTAIAELVCPPGSPIVDYMSGAELDPLRLVIASNTAPKIHIGEAPVKDRRRRRARRSLLAGGASAVAIAQSLLADELPGIVKDFVDRRLKKGITGKLMFAGSKINYKLATTTQGLHIIAGAQFTVGQQPSLTSVMGPADFSNAQMPGELLNSFTRFLQSSVKVESVFVEAWTSPPHVSINGVVQLGASKLTFSFTAKQMQIAPPADWAFDLAVQTDILIQIWNSIPPAQLTRLGLQNFNPATAGLALAGLHIHHVSGAAGNTHFEAGTLATPQSNISAVDVTKLAPALIAGWTPQIVVRGVPIAGQSVDVYLSAALGEVYLTCSQSAAGRTIASTLRGESNANLAGVTTNSPTKISNFATGVATNAQLDYLAAHIWTDFGPSPGTTAKLTGVASVLGQPASFAVAVSGDGGLPDWHVAVAFDIVTFANNHMDELDFLVPQSSRRMLQDAQTGEPLVGGMKIAMVKGVATATVGALRFKGLTGPISSRSDWPTNVSTGVATLDPMQPMRFTLGGVEVFAFVDATYDGAGGQSDELECRVYSTTSFTLGEVVRKSVPAFTQCAVNSGSAPSLFCQLLFVALDIRLGPIYLSATFGDGTAVKYSANLRMTNISAWGLPPANAKFHVSSTYTNGVVWGAGIHFPVLNFDGFLRRITALSVGGTHICDLQPFSTFCQLSLNNVQLAYVSNTPVCTQVMNMPAVLTAVCGPGLHYMVDMTFPPQFSIGAFTTAALQNITQGLLGMALPTVNIPLYMPSSATMSSLRPKLALTLLMQLANGLSGRRRVQSIPDIKLGTNPAGGDILTLRTSQASFMFDASPAGFFPGFELSMKIDLTGYGTGGGNGRRRLADGHLFHDDFLGPDKYPYWPQRRHLQQASTGVYPSVVNVNTALLTGAKACGPFVEFDLQITPALSWVNPFGIANLQLTLQSFGGGMCMAPCPIGVCPVPSRVGLVGGFSWGAQPNPILSGTLFVELQMSATASQFFYGELRCTLQPCNAYSLLGVVTGGADLTALQPVLSGMGVNCNNPSCKMWLNTVGPLPAAPRTIQNYASLAREDIIVPGGFGVLFGNRTHPGYYFMGMRGFAQVNVGLTSGSIVAGFSNTLAPPAPLDWFKFGGGVVLLFNYSSAGFGLNLQGFLEWGSSSRMSAEITLASQFSNPSLSFGLDVKVFVQVPNTACTFDFQIQANAAATLGGGGLGFGGDFSFGNTRFDTGVVTCLFNALKQGIKNFWDTEIAAWTSDATSFISRGIQSAQAAAAGDVGGYCEIIPGQGYCDLPSMVGCLHPRYCTSRSHCRVNSNHGCAGLCLCGTDGVNMCACRPNDNCGAGTTNAGWGFDGCSGRRRRLQATFMNRTTPLGRKLAAHALLLGRNKTVLEPVRLPSQKSLEDADCLVWELDKHADTQSCRKHRHQFYHTYAASQRLKLLLASPGAKLFFELNEGGEVPDSYPYSNSGNNRKISMLRDHRVGVNNKRYGLSTITALTSSLANAIKDVDNFFSSFTGNVFTLHYFEMGTCSAHSLPTTVWHLPLARRLPVCTINCQRRHVDLTHAWCLRRRVVAW